MGLLGVEGEDLPGDLARGHEQRGDGSGAEALHRREPMTSVLSPEARGALGSRDGDHRIEEATGLLDDLGEALVVRVAEIALEGRRLYRGVLRRGGAFGGRGAEGEEARFVLATAPFLARRVAAACGSALRFFTPHGRDW